ncbi:hypothetical protein T08_10769 [Trichinella sp. T8]|nr:hypothetical protein T08_10769 [Trichinella sp. T8]
MLPFTVNSGSKMLGPSTNKMFLHNFILFLITTAVCYQVAVTWALDNTALGKNGVLYDKQNQNETMTKNISNQYLPKENDQNNNKINVKETVFETSIEKENITEFVIKAPLTPITLTPQTMTPIPTNFSEKVEPTNNRSKEHTDEILNMVNGSKTYGNDNVSEKLKAGKTYGSVTPQMKMLMENVTNMVNGSKIYGNDNVSEKLKAGKTNGSGVELIQNSPSNYINKNTSTPIPCAPTVSCTDKGLNESFHNSTVCEGYLRKRVFLAVSVTVLGMGFIGIITLYIRRFQPMKMLRSIIERRRNGENHRNFCISTRAEQEMVSFGEKAE